MAHNSKDLKETWLENHMKIMRKYESIFARFWTIFMVHIWNRYAPKLFRIILLHFGLITFRIHLKKTRNSSFPWFSDVLNVSMTPQTNIIYLWRHHDTPNNSREAHMFFFSESYCGENHFWKSEHLKFSDKDGGQKFPTLRLLISWRSWIWAQ